MITKDTNRIASLQRMVPDLFTKARSVLYVGARTDRFQLSKELKQAGCKISVLEIFDKNVEHLKTLDLEEVIPGDVRTFAPSRRYDVAIWWHGPEHVTEAELPDAVNNLEGCADLVILGCPWGHYHQGSMYGNEHEKHVSHYEAEVFTDMGYEVECLGQENKPGSNITAVKLFG